MNKNKWYENLLIALIIIILSPLIILVLICAGTSYLFQLPKNKKAYKNSLYYAEFKQEFETCIFYSYEYRFYNSAMRRKLPLKYVKQESNGFEYFIYNETIYLFPDFDQMDWSEDGAVLEVDYDGDWKPFDESYKNLLSKLENSSEYPVKLLVERNMIQIFNLNEVQLPDCIFVTWSYENAFENEDSPLKMIAPKDINELYDMMLQTPDLCGKFGFSEDKRFIVWDLFENIRLEIGMDFREGYISIQRLLFGKIESGITHWHPSKFEIYDDVCSIGKRGNVLVLRSRWFGDSMLYSGSKEECPYSPDKKYLFGKYYYFENV